MVEFTIAPPRILRGATVDVVATVTDDGDPVEGSAVATVTREDGTVLLDEVAATHTTGGEYAVALTPTETGLLDVLTVALTVTDGASAEHVLSFEVEVAGGFLFSLAEARKIEPLDDTTTYTDADIALARRVAEEALEAECGVAFVPRYGRDKLDGATSRYADLIPTHPKVSTVRAVSINGTALTGDDLAAVEPLPDGTLYRPCGWCARRRAIEVAYEHGYARPPANVGIAALKLARYFLVDSTIDDRASAVSNGDGTYQLFVTAGVRGAIFSIPEANAVVEAFGGFKRGFA